MYDMICVYYMCVFTYVCMSTRVYSMYYVGRQVFCAWVMCVCVCVCVWVCVWVCVRRIQEGYGEDEKKERWSEWVTE